MDIILIKDTGGQMRRLRLMPWSPRFWVPLVVAPVLLLAGAGWLGYTIAEGEFRPALFAQASSAGSADTAAQQRISATIRQRIEDSIQALAQRVGRLQAQLVRLNAAGKRMVAMAGLSGEEFRFGQPPPIGGPIPRDSQSPPSISIDQLQTQLDRLAQDIARSERQMDALRELMIASHTKRMTTPAGWPVEEGFISSGFGMRRDPFTGAMLMHEGIDFAAQAGSDVHAVAAGVVTRAGRVPGYGLLVEITHGNGYVTRYGHNRKILVEVGERVQRGEVIAKVGSTGRSTGPHVHFEVLRNGKPVNPAQYVRASR